MGEIVDILRSAVDCADHEGRILDAEYKKAHEFLETLEAPKWEVWAKFGDVSEARLAVCDDRTHAFWLRDAMRETGKAMEATFETRYVGPIPEPEGT